MVARSEFLSNLPSQCSFDEAFIITAESEAAEKNLEKKTKDNELLVAQRKKLLEEIQKVI